MPLVFFRCADVNVVKFVNVMVLAVAIALIPDSVRGQGTITVNSTADNTADDGLCTLREAILNANADSSVYGDCATGSGMDVITFSIPGAGPHTIRPTRALPSVQGNLTIDGYTQPGARENELSTGTDAVLQIQLDGSISGGGANGIEILGSSNRIRGLVINRFAGDGIHMSGPDATSNVIEGNFLGTSIDGAVDLGNGQWGVFVWNDAASNTIGGTSPGARNVISGNALAGIGFQSAGVDNRVEGNYIGLEAGGMGPLGNSESGVSVNGSSGIIIGGQTDASRNVISGNALSGVAIFPGTGDANSNFVLNNFIGTDATGTGGVANVNGAGVDLSDTSDNLIVGNVIAGNGQYGIALGSGTSETTVQRNFIGVDSTGSMPLANGNDGIRVAGNGNLIGGIDGGVFKENRAEGAAAGVGNVIAHNSGAGIAISSQAADGNAILGNDIFENGGLGIDLGDPGVGMNDAGDQDGGSNDGQNYPEFTNVFVDTSELVLNSLPNTTYRIELFSNAIQDSSGYGEGQTFQTAFDVTTDDSGVASMSFITGLNEGVYLTGTATDLNTNNTSEFSLAVQVKTNQAPVIVSAIEDLKLMLGDPAFTDDLAARFNDPDGHDLIYAATSSDDGVATAVVTGSVLTVEPRARGNATITVTADDGRGLQTSMTFDLEVEEIDIPTGTIDDRVLVLGGAPFTPNLATVFNDPDGTLAYSASSSSPAVASAAVAGTILTVRQVAVGSTTITVLANNEQGTQQSTSFNVDVVEPPSFITVNTTEDLDNGLCDMAHCSLREAIRKANQDVDEDRIVFDIPGVAPHALVLTADLPVLSTPVVVDAATQPGSECRADNNHRLQIILDGSGYQDSNGLTIASDGTTLRGFSLVGFSERAIDVRAGDDNLIDCNFIGLEPDGTDTGNAGVGLSLSSTTNTDVSRNVIAGNTGGVFIASGNGATIANNFIGIGPSGDLLIGNRGAGMEVRGGSNMVLRENTVGGSGTEGIVLTAGSDNILFERNYIGTDVAGTLNFRNASHGMHFIDPRGHTIGGLTRDAGNVIANNGGTGILIESADDASTGNAIVGNSIYANEGLGIDLVGASGNPGVTLNDAGDTDTGPNGLQNFPVLFQIRPNAVIGLLDSAPNMSYRIEFFSSTDTDVTGHGEGQFFLGAQEVTTNGIGTAQFTFSASPEDGDVSIDVGAFISATATDPDGNTSEFGRVQSFGRIQFFQALATLPDSGAVDIYVDDILLLDNLVFRDASEFLVVQTGTRKIDVVEGTASNNSDPLLSETIDIDSDNYFIASQGGVGAVPSLAVFGDRRLVSVEDSVDVFFYNGVPDVPDGDVDFSRANPRDFDEILELFEEDVAFGDATDYVRVRAGVHVVNVREDDPVLEPGNFLFDLAPFSGRSIALSLTGLVGEGALKDMHSGVGMTGAESDEGNEFDPRFAGELARFQLVYAMPEGAPLLRLRLGNNPGAFRGIPVPAHDETGSDVDFDFSDDVLLDTLASGSAKPFVFLRPRTPDDPYTFNIDAGERTFAVEDVAIEPNKNYYFIAHGRSGQELVLEIVEDVQINEAACSDSDPSPCNQFMLFNSAPHADALTIRALHTDEELTPFAGVVQEGFSFGQNSDYFILPKEPPPAPINFLVENRAGDELKVFSVDFSEITDPAFMINIMGGSSLDVQDLELRLVQQRGGRAEMVPIFVPTDVDESVEFPVGFTLHGAFPNPFTVSTTIEFDLPEGAEVRTELYNVMGQQVLTLPAERKTPGSRQYVRVDASALASGVYLYRVIAESIQQTYTATGRLVVVR